MINNYECTKCVETERWNQVVWYWLQNLECGILQSGRTGKMKIVSTINYSCRIEQLFDRTTIWILAISSSLICCCNHTEIKRCVENFHYANCGLQIIHRRSTLTWKSVAVHAFSISFGLQMQSQYITFTLSIILNLN